MLMSGNKQIVFSEYFSLYAHGCGIDWPGHIIPNRDKSQFFRKFIQEFDDQNKHAKNAYPCSVIKLTLHCLKRAQSTTEAASDISRFFQSTFCVKPYVPRESLWDPSNRRLNEHGIYPILPGIELTTGSVPSGSQYH